MLRLLFDRLQFIHCLNKTFSLRIITHRFMLLTHVSILLHLKVKHVEQLYPLLVLGQYLTADGILITLKELNGIMVFVVHEQQAFDTAVLFHVIDSLHHL